MSAVLIIAAKEIRDGLRNRWILGSVLLLAALALVLALLGSTPGGTVKASALSVSIVNLASLSVYLLPLLGLLLAFDALVGEHERGTLLLLLTYPVRRWQIVLGKLVGHSVILALALLIGYGGTGLLLAWLHGVESGDGLAYLRLLGSSLLLGMVFLGLGYLLSSLVRERATAVAAAMGVWLGLVVLYDMALLGALIIDQGRLLSTGLVQNLVLLNPTDAYRVFNLAASVSVNQLTGLADVATVQGSVTLVVLVGWLLVPVVAAIWRLQNREL